MKRIPIGDFPIGPEEREAINRVLSSGRISEHREVRAFEQEYAAWLGVKHCIATSSGTAALMVGLKALQYCGMISSTNVLIPALTFIATANAVKLTGMEPIFGDISPTTFGLQPISLLECHADLIMPVHLFGYAADMTSIVIRASGITGCPIVVEDACEAHGTVHRGRKIGTFGLWSAFSFYIAHSIQAGELGCLCTDNDDIAAIARSIKVHGRACDCKICTRNESFCPHLENEHGDPRFTFNYIGYNFKPMEFQAALARVQLRHAEENFAKRRENFAIFASLIGIMRGHINPIYRIKEQVPMAFPIVLQKEGIRDKVIVELERRGVEARPLFGCIPTQQPAYAEYKERYLGTLPIAEYYGANGFYVGCHQYLDEEDIERMSQVVIEVVKGLS